MKNSVKKEIEEIIKYYKFNCSVEGFENHVCWTYISWKNNLSEDFIREFKDQLNWNYISSQQVLSEDFIREFKDKVDWSRILINQELSKDFVVEFKNLILDLEDTEDWKCISYYQNITKKDIEKHEKKLEQKELEKTRVKNRFQLIRF